MAALLLALSLQSDPRAQLLDAIEKADLKATRQAVDAVVRKDDDRAAHALIGAQAKARDRLKFLDRALVDAQKALSRYQTMPVLTPADRKERREGIESSEKRIQDVLAMARNTEDACEALRGAFRWLKSEAALGAVAEELERSQFWLVRCEMAEAVGTMSQEDGERRLRERLAREREPAVLAALIDALGSRVALAPESVAAIAGQLAHKAWPVQIMAARALGTAGAREGAGPLVAAIQQTDGRVRNEMNGALKSLAKVDFHGDPAGWADWWKANADDFLAGRYNPSQPKRPPGAGRTTFYELPVLSRRLAVVIDRSRSMKEVPEKGTQRKIDIARAELKALLASLPDGTRVNIIFFNDEITAFSQTTRALDARSRRDAAAFIDRIEPDGPTNLWDALDRALSLAGTPETGFIREDGVDTIFVLSDGAPTCGKISEPDVILRRFTRENRFLRAAVHTVAVGDAGTLLSRLADLNDGTSTQK